MQAWVLLIVLALSGTWPVEGACEDPQRARALLKEAYQAKQRGDLDETLRLLAEAYRLDPKPKILNNIGKTLEDMGRYREATEEYKRVVDNPTADPNLRALDAGRIGALAIKLTSSWVRLKGVGVASAGGPKVWVKDKPITEDDVEIPAPAGRAVVEVLLPSGEHALLRETELLTGTRTDLTKKQLSVPGSWPVLDLSGWDPPPAAIEVNGHIVNADLAKLKRITVAPGRRSVRVTGADAKAVEETRSLSPGERWTLAQPERRIEPMIAPVVTAAPVLAVEAPPPKIETPKVDEVEPAPSQAVAYVPDEKSSWPWVFIGLGSASAVGGAAMWFLADRDRDKISTAKRDFDGAVIGMLQTEAESVEEDAKLKSDIGTWLIAGGGAVGAIGIIWALVDSGGGGGQAASDSMPMVGIMPDGIMIRGVF